MKTPVHCLSCLGNTVVNTLPTVLCNLLTKDVRELLTSSAGPLKLGGGGDPPSLNFVRYVNPFSTRGADYVHYITVCPPFDF